MCTTRPAPKGEPKVQLKVLRLAAGHECCARECHVFQLFSSRKNKGLWWIPRHPKTMKGVLTDDTLRRAGMTL